MDKYISSEVATQILRKEAASAYPTPYHIGLFAAARAIESIPAADVRPVVLCKDCIYYYCETCSRRADGTYMKPNDFCSRGAKGEENNG